VEVLHVVNGYINGFVLYVMELNNVFEVIKKIMMMINITIKMEL